MKNEMQVVCSLLLVVAAVSAKPQYGEQPQQSFSSSSSWEQSAAPQWPDVVLDVQQHHDVQQHTAVSATAWATSSSGGHSIQPAASGETVSRAELERRWASFLERMPQMRVNYCN